MTKLRLQISVLVFLSLYNTVSAQNTYQLRMRGVDKDSAWIVSNLGIQTSFASRDAGDAYINKLPNYLRSKGYVTASIDSLQMEPGSTRIVLYIGEEYRWARLDAKYVESPVLEAVGWREKMFSDQPIDFTQVQQWQERILDHYENNGYPFARVWLDSLSLEEGKNVSALLKAEKGPLYKIDSIRLFGNARISNHYLQHYLDIPNGSYYNKQKLLGINKKIRELTYVEEVQPANLTLLGTGSVLNLYLKEKKSSQVNILVGFLPNNDQLSSRKLLLTGEANILLRNMLGSGETIGVNWQQIQVKSPRLNLLYQHPYLFKSPLGLDFAFDMFRKDSSYLNVNFSLGAHYILNATQSGKLFIQRIQTVLSEGGINSALIIQTRRLPDIADVSSFNVGLDYEMVNTDYRFNPKKGNELRITTAIGNKIVKKNNQVLALKDPGDPGFDFGKLYDTIKLKTYQLRVRAVAAKYFPLGKQSTLKTAVNAGMFQSRNTFRNELFQVGGYKLLRGFDEESQYLSHFAIATIEYRLLYIVGQNSYFYALADGGWGRGLTPQSKVNYTYLGTGLGLAFETKAGIFNLAWAIGKRNDTQFNLRQSKIHFGFVNYF